LTEPALDRIEVDSDLAHLLRRFASREGMGLSAVLQEALLSYARSRLWEPIETEGLVVESVDEEVRLFLLAMPPELLRRDRKVFAAELARRYGKPVAGARGLAIRGLRRLLERLEAS